jgi:3-methyladenine DNA glycosylase AlkD/GNAT superfamily N-acetyltransferase
MKDLSRSSSTPTKRSSQSHSRMTVPRWAKAAVLRELKGLADPKVRAKMGYFGVNVPKAHGISAPVLHKFAKHIGKDHRLAQQLWSTGNHEARILATLIGEADKVTAAEMERWARDFDSWDVVDTACCYLYAHTRFAWKKAAAWSRRDAEFEKRAAFSLVAYLSYKDGEASDARFTQFLKVIEREAYDERNFVRKAVNWSLRNPAEPGSNSRGGENQEAGFTSGALDRGGCTARTEKRRHTSAASAEGGLIHMANANKNGLKIRRAKSGDAPQLAELSGQLGYPATEAQIRERLRGIKPASDHAVLVAESPTNGVIGWLHVSKQPLLEMEIRGEVNTLVVAEGQRSLGAGARLLAAAEVWARKHGCKGMSVRSNVIRERAHRFYERNGYEHYKTQKSFRKPL